MAVISSRYLSSLQAESKVCFAALLIRVKPDRSGMCQRIEPETGLDGRLRPAGTRGDIQRQVPTELKAGNDDIELPTISDRGKLGLRAPAIRGEGPLRSLVLLLWPWPAPWVPRQGLGPTSPPSPNHRSSALHFKLFDILGGGGE